MSEYAVHNPHAKPVVDLPVIYGFNNGLVSHNCWHAQLIAQDGTPLGSHICSNEWFMPGDLGVLEGSRPDRHETFREHYPDGYRMEFVRYDEVAAHEALQAAFKLLEANHPEPKGGEARMEITTTDQSTG